MSSVDYSSCCVTARQIAEKAAAQGYFTYEIAELYGVSERDICALLDGVRITKDIAKKIEQKGEALLLVGHKMA